MKRHEIKPGARFKDWTVISRAENYKRERAYLCRCKCGKTKIIPSQKLLSENECHMCKECSYENFKKHGDAQQSRRGTRHPIYIAWDNMLRRCENEKHPCHHLYGGRGIKVCDEWHDYIVFRDWALNNGWRKGLSIDRIDNNGNYTPKNCRWTNQKVQARNSRSTKWETINGQKKTRGDWLKFYNVSSWFVHERMKKFNISFVKAIQMPRLRDRKENIA